MAHAPTFNEFIPSVEEALLYKREWMLSNDGDYDRYITLSNVFSNRTAFKEQCYQIYHTYAPRQDAGLRDMSAKYLETHPDILARLDKGDISAVDELKRFAGGNQYVFATMYCHHFNSKAYYAFSNPICNCLVRLNQLDEFCYLFEERNLYDYQYFHNIMTQFVKYYHLESLTHLELDIMLRKASELK